MTALPGAVRAALNRTRGAVVTDVRPRPAGANSEVWEVASSSGARYFVKRYPAAVPGETDRLGAEFAALAFMATHGVRQVPEAVCALPEERIGIFGLVVGRPLAAADIGEAEVRQAADFLARLHALRQAAGARELPVAKEACFSIVAHEALVRGRAARLREASQDAALRDFLDGDFAAHLERVASWIGDAARAGALDPGAELPESARTLSPSDFGFHNALRRADGTLVFIDFEYFGWDDPAKTVADALLQPAVPVPERLRRPFCRELLRAYGPEAGLERRLPPVYALLALKWCLIVLNLFVRAPGDTALLGERLTRARVLLERARCEFAARGFPYGGL